MNLLVISFVGIIFVFGLVAGMFFLQIMFVIDPFLYRKKVERGRTAIMNMSMRLMLAQKEIQARNHDLEMLSLEIQKANQDLSRLNELKTKFFHIVTHEIRNPLGIITGFVDSLHQEKYELLSAEQKSYIVDAMTSASKRANLLLSDLTDLVAIETGKFKMQLLPSTFKELLKMTKPSLDYIVKQKAIQLIVDCAPDLPTILMDSNRIMQVFINLVTNSSKFTPEKGTILVTVGPDHEKAEHVLIQIKDSGAGFPPEEKEKIFSRFYQSKNQDENTRRKGFGLGLFIVSEIVKFHQGSVWADSKGMGTGATFFVRLPFMPKVEES